MTIMQPPIAFAFAYNRSRRRKPHSSTWTIIVSVTMRLHLPIAKNCSASGENSLRPRRFWMAASRSPLAARRTGRISDLEGCRSQDIIRRTLELLFRESRRVGEVSKPFRNMPKASLSWYKHNPLIFIQYIEC